MACPSEVPEIFEIEVAIVSGLLFRHQIVAHKIFLFSTRYGMLAIPRNYSSGEFNGDVADSLRVPQTAKPNRARAILCRFGVRLVAGSRAIQLGRW
jgi:hypothetical protein